MKRNSLLSLQGYGNKSMGGDQINAKQDAGYHLLMNRGGNTVVANTDSEKRKGLTGAPKGSTGVFNYMSQEPREFVRTDRDLQVFADGQKVGNLTKSNPRITVPPASQVVEKEMNSGGGIYGMMKSPKYQDGGDVAQDNVIHSRFDPRYSEYQTLRNRAHALNEYKKWHRELSEANPMSGAEFQQLEAKSDSLAVARKYLPVSEGDRKDKPVLWTNPNTGGSIRKELDMSPVNNPYTVDIAPTPWSGKEDAQKQGDDFRKWVNETYPEKAKSWQLDATGNPDNDFTRSAYYELGEEYELSKPMERLEPLKPQIPMTPRPEPQIQGRSIPAQPKQPEDKVVTVPSTETNWVQHPVTGTWYERKRPGQGTQYNLSTGGTKEFKKGGKTLYGMLCR